MLKSDHEKDKFSLLVDMNQDERLSAKTLKNKEYLKQQKGIIIGSAVLIMNYMEKQGMFILSRLGYFTMLFKCTHEVNYTIQHIQCISIIILLLGF